ncbi:MAG TPA: sulfatase, partial [Gemmatimonadales bacterium]|nr:sulfatase [Gemmatimonadales bacterium]
MSDSAAPGVRLSPRAILFLGLAAGLLTGLIEVLVLLSRRLVLGRLVHVSAHFGWMAPVGDLVLFALPALALALCARLWPRLVPAQLVFFLFAFVGFAALVLMEPGFQKLAALALAAGLAFQTARMLSRRTEAWERRSGKVLGTLAAVVTLIGLATVGFYTIRERLAIGRLPAAAGDRPNVLLIILDTVRAKSLSLYGYHRDTSPSLIHLAERGVRFDRAFATAPWTLPSHASLLTGDYPHQLSADWVEPLDRKVPTLAERFKAEGYVTGGFVANVGYLSWEFGLNRGFAHYEDYLFRPRDILESTSIGRQLDYSFLVRDLLRTDQHLVRIDAPSINRRFLNWVAQRGDRPFFAFLNYYDAHGPYLPPAPWDRRYGSPRTDDRSTLHRFLGRPFGPLPQTVVEREMEQYDGALAYLDNQIGQLIEELDRRHVLDHTIVLLTADHGEEFGEHGLFDHGNSLYRPSVQVPLLVVYRGTVPEGGRVEQPVTLRDVAATLADLAGLPSGVVPGASLARFWRGSFPLEPRTQSPVISEVSKGIRTPPQYPVSRGDMRSLVEGGQRYILGGDGTEQIFDLGDDWEHHPL